MSKYVKCVHDVDNPKHSIVVDPMTFMPLCGCCKIFVEDFDANPPAKPAIEAYKRAMKLVRK